MALSDKNILITPNIGSSSDPKITFSGADASTGAQTITLNVYPTNNGTLSFEGSNGQLFSIGNTMSGTIYSVNDISGIPSIEVLDTGLIKLGQYSGNVLLGSGTDLGAKFQVWSGTPSGVGSLPSGVISTQSSSGNNYLLFRNGADNGTYAGIAMQDNNIGGYVVFGNAGGGGDKMYIAGYGGVEIQYGSADSINPGARTTALNITSSSVNSSVALQQSGNQVLHAGNYTSYSPSLTGSGASGTWGINITGNAATLGGYAPNTTGGANLIVQRDSNGYIQNNYFYSSGGGSERNASGMGYFAGFNSSDYYIRSYTNAAAASIIQSAASGTWGINITGNAATATNSTQLGGSAAANFVQGDGSRGRSTSRSSGSANSLTDPSGFYFGSTVTGMPSTDWWNWTQCIGNSWSAPDGYGYQLAYSFWGDDIRMRRLQSGTWQGWVNMLHSSNYNNYAPSLTGAGASGTWGISISGTAALATRASGNFYIDSNYGRGIVGTYASTRYQGVFAMGDSYKLADDGTTTGSLYGMAWSHPNAGGVAGNLDSHGMIVMINGGFGSCMSYSIKASGNVTAYSDERLKTNWRDMPKDYITNLSQVKVGIYDRTDGEQLTQVGVSAQSLQKVLPEAIITADDEIKTLSVNYGGAALASAVELAKEVVDLRARVASLEALISKLIKE